LQFRYRLEGQDGAWQDVGNRRRAYYTGLGPGTYTFHVDARIGESSWSNIASALTFRVLPAWYQTIWFRLGVVSLIGAVGAALATFVQRRRHRVQREALARQYAATLAERSRIARELHDTLLSELAGVAMQLGAAAQRVERSTRADSTVVEAFSTLGSQVRRTLVDARRRVTDMREPGERVSLEAALTTAAQRVFADSAIVA